MRVSVVIPAHNAADTLAETLDSLLAQTVDGWEAIVIDDGSVDATAEIAAQYVERDPRISCVRQKPSGLCAARNAGIRNARHEWLLFLDADDWLAPEHLERLTGVLRADSRLDAVHCGSVRITPGGATLTEEFWPGCGDLFPVLARRPAFPVHACIVRRSIVEAVGAFDVDVTILEDWDLWQRVARAGGRWGGVREPLAYYRVRPGSMSMNGARMLTGALRVLRLGRTRDPRVGNPASEYTEGLPARDWSAEFYFACWSAGLVLGSGGDARPLLTHLAGLREPHLDPRGVADTLFRAVTLPTCQTPADWTTLWPRVESDLEKFLVALEQHSGAPGLARRAGRRLEQMIVRHAATPPPLLVGRTYVAHLDVTRPIPDIHSPAGAELLFCEISVAGERLGALELPICDGWVPSRVLADAIAACFAWPILGRFLQATVYAELRVTWEVDGASLWRGDLRVAHGLRGDEDAIRAKAHDRVGWTIFLQELWNRPGWPADRFYTPSPQDKANGRVAATDEWFPVEVAGDLPDLDLPVSGLDVIPTVGGVPLGVVSIAPAAPRLSAQELRATIMQAAGFELCRAAVREGVLGRPLADGTPLRHRLMEAAANRTTSHDSPSPASSVEPVPRSSELRALAANEAGPVVLLGRRASGSIGTSSSRCAVLPAGAAPELVESAEIAGEPVLRSGSSAAARATLFYCPDLVWHVSGPRPPAPPRRSRLLAAESEDRGPTVTERLPILRYGRVASQHERSCITPEALEEQLHSLRDAGFRSVGLEDWREAACARQPLPGRCVLITFDAPDAEFRTRVWPLLRRYGFGATVFLVPEDMGGVEFHRRDARVDEPASLLGWDQVRELEAQGLAFGIRFARNAPLTALSPVEIARRAARSRLILQKRLHRPHNAIACSYGEGSPAVEHLIGACGFVYGLVDRGARAGYDHSLLSLPRIQIVASDTLADFGAKLEG